MTMTNLFATATAINGVSNGRQLVGTERLTSLAADGARTILDTVNHQMKENPDDVTLAERVQQSMTDINALQGLIDEFYAVDTVDIDFLKELDKDSLESMLKSQQSKRSRAKGKQMSMENYMTLMTAFLAENLLRLALGKDKVSSNVLVGSQYSQEALDALAADQDKLKKEIRNVQSKKSIMKSKANFTEEDEKWQSLLEAEASLKAIRDNASPVVRVVDGLRDSIKELLAEVDVDKLKAHEAKELIESIKALAFDDVTNDESESEEA